MNLSSEFWDFVSKYEANLTKFNQIHNLTNYKTLKSVAIDSVEMLIFLAKFINSDLDDNTPNLDSNSSSNLPNLGDMILFVGPEGGFSDRERQMFELKFAFRTNYILRSISAVVALGAMFLA